LKPWLNSHFYPQKIPTSLTAYQLNEQNMVTTVKCHRSSATINASELSVDNIHLQNLRRPLDRRHNAALQWAVSANQADYFAELHSLTAATSVGPRMNQVPFETHRRRLW